MTMRIMGLGLLGLAVIGCSRAVTPAVAIPPAADAVPLSIPEADDEDEFDAPVVAAAPRRCEVPPRAGAAEPDFSQVARAIEAMLDTSEAPSVAVAVARDEQILWERGFGLADPRRRRKADEHTMYSLASISKPFTATGIMVLEQQQKLRLDQPLSELLPPPGLRAGAGDPAQATVERVASHTAGLPLHWQFYYEGKGDGPPPLATTRERYAVTITPPGTRYAYSNLGFGLLDQAIAHVSGRPYAEFMKAEVFEPLDLRHTFVGTPPRGSGTVAVRTGARGKPLPDYGFDHDGASALYSSAHDLVRFGMFHIGHRTAEQTEILSAEARARMVTPVAPSERYGLGLGVRPVGAVTRVGHNGGMPGVRTALVMYPEQGVVVVVLANGRFDREHVVDLVTDALGVPYRSDEICALPAGHALVRAWEGQVDTIAGPRDLALQVRTDGEVMVAVGDAPPRSVRQVAFRDDVLTGWVWGDVAAELGGGEPTILRFDLHLRGGVLEGGVSAVVPSISTTTLFARLRPSG